MATCRSVIHAALRKIGVVDPGVTPSPDEAEAGLAALQGLYDGWITGGKFGRLKTVRITADYTAKENERIYVDTDETVNITIPDSFTDCETGKLRSPKDLSVILITDREASQQRRYIWDAQIGRWTALHTLALNDTAPLALRDQDGMACCLAECLADEFGGRLGQITSLKAGQFRSALTLKADEGESPEIEYF